MQYGDVPRREGDSCTHFNGVSAFSSSHHDVADANSTVFQSGRDFDYDNPSAIVQTFEHRHRLGPSDQTSSSGNRCSKVALQSAPWRSVEFCCFNFMSDPIVTACSFLFK